MALLTDTLIRYPVVTLFIVMGLGYWFGEISFRGFRFGVAAVLFLGLAVGSLDPRVALPEIIPSLGLIVFIYCVGIHSAPEFVKIFRKRGLQDALLTIAVLLFAALAVIGLSYAVGLPGTHAAGLFCGSLTNTPALAAVRDALSEQLRSVDMSAEAAAALTSAPVVAYSIAYPLGVLAVLGLFQLMRRVWRAEMPAAEKAPSIIARSFRVTNPGLFKKRLGEVLSVHEPRKFIVSRHRHAETTTIAHADTVLLEGDTLAAVGEEHDLEKAAQLFGTVSEEQIHLARSEFDYRRVFVSSKEAVGKKIRDLELPVRFSAVITRLRRGDTDIVPDEDTVLEYGDRVRVVTNPGNFEAITIFFGDSVKSTAQADFGAIGFGMLLGVLVGLIPIALPGGGTLRLGIAGGPLLVGLVLGYLRRTGGVYWSMPIGVNLTLRHFGLVLFLGGVGTRAGYEFVRTLIENGPSLLLSGAFVTIAATLLTLYVGFRRLGMPYDYVMGVVSGIQTQPAALAFAAGHANRDAPDLGYASVYPVATIGKIILAQVILRVIGY